MQETNKIHVTCTINGVAHKFHVYQMTRLIDVLRDEAHLTGVKEGCSEGECGACSVILNNELVNSCLIPIAQVEGANIFTIEGLTKNQNLHKVQDAFLKFGGAQCGICTPAMILAAICLLDKNPNPSEDDIRIALSGNLCRCTGYSKIFESIIHACSEKESGKN